MVKQLRKGMNVRTAREMNAKLQNIEGQADELELELLRDLYQGNYDPKHIIFLCDLYELLEKVIDRCRDACNVVFQIVLKLTYSCDLAKIDILLFLFSVLVTYVL